MDRLPKYEFRLVVIIGLIVVLVVSSGILVYNKISGIVDNVSIQTRPDERLLLMKEVNKNLISAENDLFSYTLSRDSVILDQFDAKVSSTEQNIAKLRKHAEKDSRFGFYVDSLEKLVNRKYAIMDALLIVQDEYRVNRALNKVAAEIGNIRVNARESGAEKLQQQVQEEKKRRRLFRRKEQVPQQTVPDGEAVLKTVSREINTIRKDEQEKEIKGNELQLSLEKEDALVMRKINNLLSYLEYEERQLIISRTKEARRAAIDTNTIVAVFIFSSVILLIVASWTIYNYVIYNNTYKRALKKSKQESEELAESKSRFLANMSHEIRTPMNAIIGFSEQLGQTELSKEQREQVRIIEQSASYLVTMINEILDLSKLQSEKIQLEKAAFDLREELTSIVHLLQPLAEENGNRLETNFSEDLPNWIYGDSFRIRQILLNLLGNALKFTREGRVELEARAATTDGRIGTLKLIVRDTGIGIEPRNLGKIFDEFEQANEAVSKTFGGTGLGLAITKKLVDLHQGTIAVESTWGKGSCFTVEIPFEVAENPGPTTVKSKVKETDFLRGKHLLIVDDEVYNRKLLQKILHKYDTITMDCEDGVQALELISGQKFDAVLMDLHMPNMDGIELTRRIRSSEDEQVRKMPLLVLTAAIDPAQQEKLRENGMDRLIFKPFRQEELLQALQEIFSLRPFSEPQNELIMEPEQPKNGSLYDLEPLRRQSGGDGAFFNDMIETFIRTTEEGVAQVRQRFEDGDRTGLAEAAHRISAPCRHLHAHTLYVDLKEIERLGRSEDTGEAIPEELILRIEEQAGIIVSSLKEELR